MATYFAAGSCGQAVGISTLVESSMIRNMEWNNYCGNGEIIVRFWSGDTYVYEGVGLQVFMTVAQSASVGKAFNNLVKGKYEYRKMPSLQPVPA